MEIFWYCFVGAIFGFAGLLALVLGVWQIAMHVKERNLLEQMRLEFEAKRAGWTDAEWIAFRVPWYELMRRARNQPLG